MKPILTVFVFGICFTSAHGVLAATWQCRDSTGHTYKASQNVQSDRCSFVGEASPYPGYKKTKAEKTGVAIGMSQDEVVHDTVWGKPKKVNRTTNKYGTHEQWVYGSGNYLYFENGVLTSFQN